MTSNMTIIDSKGIRGVVAPAKVLPRELLEDILDLIELSVSKEARKTQRRLKSADRAQSWIPLSKIVRKH